jgi:mRNA-degrading endonuclease RelE of RelBE toxin-antitoxin system
LIRKNVALRIDWSEEARADIRRLDRPTAMRIFEGLLRFARTGKGDLKQLHGDLAVRHRLRIGDYRVFLTQSPKRLLVHAVQHRSQAFR